MKRRAQQIIQFYRQRASDLMFRKELFTPQVRAYLDAERAELDLVVHHQPAYRGIVEVGAGTGTYLDWAGKRELAYTGIDIVAPLIETGRGRLANHSRLSQAPAQLLHQSFGEFVTKPESSILEQQLYLIVFPFNCFGNIPDIFDTLAHPKLRPADLFISCFSASPEASKARCEYYQRCGFSGIKRLAERDGELVASEEGLLTKAYHTDQLTKRLESLGFILQGSSIIGQIGIALHFRGPDSAEKHQILQPLEVAI